MSLAGIQISERLIDFHPNSPAQWRLAQFSPGSSDKILYFDQHSFVDASPYFF
jgi:hypothetical protein